MQPKNTGLCSVCRLRHDNIGYMPTDRHPVKWCCLECLNTKTLDDELIVRIAYNMRNFDAYEKAAIEAGGNSGGEYLETLGKTDLATLHEDEYQKFLQAVFRGYAENIRETLASGKAPF